MRNVAKYDSLYQITHYNGSHTRTKSRAPPLNHTAILVCIIPFLFIFFFTYGDLELWDDKRTLRGPSFCVLAAL